tara:strand:+ start:66 stop:503 length:438 start_codon:yes stop_codon:yes gene_type:complete
MTHAFREQAMGILRIHAAATAHELQDIGLVHQALEWLTETEWDVDMTTSYHGPKVALFSTQICKNKEVNLFMQKLEPCRKTILAELEQRLDGDNTIHLRLDLESVIGGKLVLVQTTSTNPVIKIRIKLAVYPGQDVRSIATGLFT